MVLKEGTRYCSALSKLNCPVVFKSFAEKISTGNGVSVKVLYAFRLPTAIVTDSNTVCCLDNSIVISVIPFNDIRSGA